MGKDRPQHTARARAKQEPRRLAAAVRLINTNNPLLLDLAEQVQALKLQVPGSRARVSLSGQLVMLTQRLARNANAMLGADVIDPEVAFLMGKDTTTSASCCRA